MFQSWVRKSIGFGSSVSYRCLEYVANAMRVGAPVRLHDTVAAAATLQHQGNLVCRDGTVLSLSANIYTNGVHTNEHRSDRTHDQLQPVVQRDIGRI